MMTRSNVVGSSAMPAGVVKDAPSASSSHTYRPRGTARQLFSERADEVIISGPAGTGKSRACLEKIHAMAIRNPGMRALIVRKTATSLTSSAIKTWQEDVALETLTMGACLWKGPTARTPAQYKFWNGSCVVLGGMDKATRIMSTEYDVAYVQEATELTIDDWEAITTRLRNGRVSFQQLIADCNPSTPTHWLKQRVDLGSAMMLHARHEENPRLFDASGQITLTGQAYLGKLDKLTGVRRLRLREGRWAAAEGLIYTDFDEAVHIVDILPAGVGSWTRWWAIDFGYRNPFVWQEWAESPDGDLYLVREIYYTGRTVAEHAAKIRSLNAIAPRAIITDHDAEGRATLEHELCVSTSAAHKAVTEGIQATQERFKARRVFLYRDALVERDPELVDSKKPTCTLEELPGYVWQDKAKEAPVKEDDHGCDAMRYVVAEVDLGVQPGMRVMSW